MNAVEQYISQFPESTQTILNNVRELIFSIAPDAEESISYGMPAYKVNGKVLVYFAGYKNHLGVYALPTTHQHFQEELSNYKHGKGSVQFPLNHPIPYGFIKQMVEFRLNELKKNLPQ